MIKDKILNQVFFPITSSNFHRGFEVEEAGTAQRQPYTQTTSSAAPQTQVSPRWRGNSDLARPDNDANGEPVFLPPQPSALPAQPFRTATPSARPTSFSPTPNAASVCSYVPFTTSLLPLAPRHHRKVCSPPILSSACRYQSRTADVREGKEAHHLSSRPGRTCPRRPNRAL